MPILDKKDPIGTSLATKVPKILGIGSEAAPKAIILVTAHWMTRRPTISNGQKHSLYYDYGGFPAEAYNLKYDAPGSPEIAGQIYKALEKIGMSPEMDSSRGTVSQPADRSLEAKYIYRLGPWRLRPHAPHQSKGRYPSRPTFRLAER